MTGKLNVATYGADRTGLICGFAFGPSLAGREVHAEEALEGARSAAPGSFA